MLNNHIMIFKYIQEKIVTYNINYTFLFNPDHPISLCKYHNLNIRIEKETRQTYILPKHINFSL